VLTDWGESEVIIGEGIVDGMKVLHKPMGAR
jgi:hypothetical protein